MAGIHHSTPWRCAHVRRAAAFTCGLFVAVSAALAPAHAEKVGVAAAVNPDAFSSLSGVPNKQLNIGKSIFYDERISTTNSGLVQVLLVDGSTFTVGPNSNLVIDKFVYDPRKKTGELVATFSKGTMRFIGGKLSKNEGGVTVNTPSGALAIRGGMFQGSTSRGVYSFLFGHSLTFRGRNGQTQTIYETGYSLVTHGGQATVRPTTPEDTNAFMAALSSSGTNLGAGAGGSDNAGNPAGTQQQLANIENGADQEISDANFVMVQTSIQQQLARLNDLKNNTPPPNNNNNNTPPASGGTSPPDPVVKNGGEFNGYASGFVQTGKNGKGEPDIALGTSRVVLDPKTNTVTSNINVTKTEFVSFFGVPIPKSTTNYSIGYSGVGNGAYIDDDTFLALGDDGSTKVVHTELWPRFRRTEFDYVTHLPPADDQQTAGFASVPEALCSAGCKFLKYGFWGADITYSTEPTELDTAARLRSGTDKMGGWWVASSEPPIASKDMPTLGTASYSGFAVGTLAERSGQSHIWQQRPATGNLDMNWDFAKRSGHLSITDFGGPDGKKFGGHMIAPGRVDFGGVIKGSGGLGVASGSFVGSRGPGNAPAGVMGNFGIGAKDWKANGIFGGQRVPNAIAGN